jgi:nitrite reductase (NADH) small subunit
MDAASQFESPDDFRTSGRWLKVCELDSILPNTGICALFGTTQVAIVRAGMGESVFAIDNFDPFSRAFVLSRGIVGDKAGVPKIASPIFKHNFDLRTGRCLDDPTVLLRTYPARAKDGFVEVFFQEGELTRTR